MTVEAEENANSRLRRGQVQGAHVPERYRDIVRPHVESFDYFIGEGIRRVLQDLEPVRVRFRCQPVLPGRTTSNHL